MNVSRKKIRIGDLLVEHQIITQEILEQALSEQKKSGRKLGHVLIENGYVAEDQILEILSEQLKIPFIDLKHYKFNPEIVRKLPEVQARRFRAIPLAGDDHGLLVGMADPTDIFAYDEMSRLLRVPVRIAVVRESDLLHTIDIVYRKTDQITGFAEELSDEITEGDIDLQAMVSGADVADAPVVKLLQSLFEDAIQIRASDIHIEPDENVLRIRQRVDGELQEQTINETRVAAPLVSRLKLIAGLDISEKRLPQDGRFSLNVKHHVVDVRLSTMPVQHGESVVMRLLDQSQGTYDLEALGMPDRVIKAFKRVIKRPHGMVLVTGPTGSGKTTTLYAALKLLNSPTKKIITVEDPVEYRLERINQVQVNSDIGLTFAHVLRSALRQDPDIVLIGEIRDEETAEIAVRAAMTGHLVLSTLHTNDAISTINRLLDMGVKSYLLSTSLHSIVAQRLVRKICESCAQPAELDAEMIEFVKHIGGEHATKGSFKRGIGCAHCNYTGYDGRVGVYEFIELDKELSRILGQADTTGFAEVARAKPGYFSLEQTVLLYAMKGITTIEEALRISADIETDISSTQQQDPNNLSAESG